MLVQIVPSTEEISLQHHVHSGGLVIAQSLAVVAGLGKLSLNAAASCGKAAQALGCFGQLSQTIWYAYRYQVLRITLHNWPLQPYP